MYFNTVRLLFDIKIHIYPEEKRLEFSKLQNGFLWSRSESPFLLGLNSPMSVSQITIFVLISKPSPNPEILLKSLTFH